MKRYILFLSLSLVLLSGCKPASQTTEEKTLILYAGRGKELVDGIIERFMKESGINVQIKYGKTAELALMLQQEGVNSPADVFWAQDAGSLGAVMQAGLLTELPQDLTGAVSKTFRNPHHQWVALTGRARTLAYSLKRVSSADLPQSIFDLSNPKWKGKIAWSPDNASFQSFLTALRKTQGEEKARAWLLAMKANEPKAYANNAAIIEAIAAGEADLGLPNHYYLLSFTDKDPNYPVGQTVFRAGDAGNLVNVSGAGILKSGKNPEAAKTFLKFILSQAGQTYMANDEFEYPVTEGVKRHHKLMSMDELDKLKPSVDLNSLADIEGTLALLKTTGIL
ncbi:MAG: iron ABC transporter substrate-binding protein [Bacteroidetes Order II. Incertae sedis bacterium]|nr:iron ABC transporter substrate-binding protein [Bacteroidetes Order II. bacterium]